MSQKHRVLVVDDSAYMRKVLSDILTNDTNLEVIGTARNGEEAIQKARDLSPDVITMDIEMPIMDGILATRRIMAECPTRIVMVSSLSRRAAAATVEALSAGAVDFIAKPSGPISLDLPTIAHEIVQKVRVAARSRPRLCASPAPAESERRSESAPGISAGGNLVVIAASTGGPGALMEVFSRIGVLPVPVVVVQHMPRGFTQSLALRLHSRSEMTVREATDGDALAPNTAYLAPGGLHTVIGAGGKIAIHNGPPVHGVKPAADPLMESAAAVFGDKVVGVVLTGMGFDGARGMARIKRAGGTTIAEDETTCVVYGMPRAVIEMGNADRVVPIFAVASEIRKALGL